MGFYATEIEVALRRRGRGRYRVRGRGCTGYTPGWGDRHPSRARALRRDRREDALEQLAARIDTKGESDLYMLENKIAPGVSFGWHSHPGPSLVILKTGALTLYRGDDPTCTPQVIQRGRASSTTAATPTSFGTKAASRRTFT